MTAFAQFAEARTQFFRSNGYLPNTVFISVPNLQTVRAESQFLIEGLTIKRRQGSEIEFSYEERDHLTVGDESNGFSSNGSKCIEY